MASTTEKKSILRWLHIAITVFFMFGFGFLPAPEPITPLGMQMLGVFLGLIYGWSFCSLAWPSLLGIVALAVTNAAPLKTFLPMGFANETVVFLLFIFAFTTAVDEEGVTGILANWCISRKVLTGRPWLLSFALILGAAVCGALTNTFAAILIFWSILYNICKQAGYKPYDKYPTLMILGIAVAATIGVCMLPYRTSPLVFLGAFQALTGETVGFAQYMIFAIPVTMVMIVAYILACRFIFRVDVSALKAVKADFVKQEDLIMNKRQKTVMGFLVAFIVLAVSTSILPKDFILTVFLNRLTTTGIVMSMLVIMLWLKIDGKPLISFQKLASKGIIWDMLLLFIIVLPLSSLLMGDDTGLKAFMIGALQPIFSGVSPIVFMVAVLSLPSIITNFANNAVTGLIFLQLICSSGVALNVDIVPMSLTLLFLANCAFLTPAASAPAALVFGNTEWIKAKDIYTMGAVMMLVLIVITMAFGLLWGNLVF